MIVNVYTSKKLLTLEAEQYTQDTKYVKMEIIAFWVTHPNFDGLIENPRVTHVEGILVHPTHPLCTVACTGEA